MKLAQVKHIALWILLICVASARARGSYSVEERLDRIKSYSQFELAKETSVVLLLGNNDFGKEFLTQIFKRGTDHPSEIVRDIIYEYLIDDFDVFVKDINGNNTVYYNCPNFDSKTNPNDNIIMAMHCIHGVMNYALEFKLLFVIESVEEIERLTEFAASFMTDLKK